MLLTLLYPRHCLVSWGCWWPSSPWGYTAVQLRTQAPGPHGLGSGPAHAIGWVHPSESQFSCAPLSDSLPLYWGGPGVHLLHPALGEDTESCPTRGDKAVLSNEVPSWKNFQRQFWLLAIFVLGTTLQPSPLCIKSIFRSGAPAQNYWGRGEELLKFHVFSPHPTWRLSFASPCGRAVWMNPFHNRQNWGTERLRDAPKVM